MYNDNLCWMVLQKKVGININKVLDRIMSEVCGTDFWQMSGSEIRRRFPFLTDRQVDDFVLGRKEVDMGSAGEYLKRKGIDILCINDDNYPDRLRNIPDPPPVLYHRGAVLDYDFGIGIIGSRKCTSYGRKNAEVFAEALSGSGFTVISGFARGIDSIAHCGSLSGRGGTVAVLGSGIDNIYPRENSRLAERILAHPKGVIVSEFPPGSPPLKFHFPMRNRIISGLSEGLLVVEAGEKSGTMITVGTALEQGRDVFALPGPINSSNCAGTNRLLKEGAVVTLSPEDIVTEYRGDYCEPKSGIRPAVQLSFEEEIIIRNLGDEPVTADELAELTGMEITEILTCLCVMEIKGVVAFTSGEGYIKLI